MGNHNHSPQMLSFKQHKGQRAETLVRHYLEKKGLSLIEKNYSCKLGEIDLIMQEDATLVFIEVRYRRQSDYGTSLDTVQTSKQNRIIKSALRYLQQHQLYDEVNCRFDVIGIDQSNKITWIKDAFQVQY